MEPIIFFAGGRLIYSILDRRGLRFLLGEFFSILFFVGIAYLLLSITNPQIRGLSIGGLFLLTALGIRRIFPKHPQEASPPSKKTDVVSIGIIDVVWIIIMGASLAFIVFAIGTAPFTDPFPTKTLAFSTNYCTQQVGLIQFLLGKFLDGILLLGGALIACMTIIWAGEVWRKSGTDNSKHYKATTFSSAKMVAAYFTTTIGFMIWIIIPLYHRSMAFISLLN